MNPRFSITVPAYNAQDTLAETIESVRCQAFEDWELVIVDDGSADNTLSVAREYASREPRIRVFTQENRGSGGAYNTAVRNSRADLIVMLAADDLLLPSHLAEFAAFIQGNSDASVFTCDGWYELPDGTRAAARPSKRWANPSRATLEELLVACFYGVGAVYRKAVWEAVGGFREDIYAEDYLFWMLALSMGYRHRHLPRPLSVHRRGETQKSADAVRMRQTDIEIIHEVMDKGSLSSEELGTAQITVARHKRSIRIRKVLSAILGQKRSARLIERLRRQDTTTPSETDQQ